jgi:hypothetical protein
VVHRRWDRQRELVRIDDTLRRRTDDLAPKALDLPLEPSGGVFGCLGARTEHIVAVSHVRDGCIALRDGDRVLRDLGIAFGHQSREAADFCFEIHGSVYRAASRWTSVLTRV